MSKNASFRRGVTRRGFLSVAVSAVVAGVVAGVGAYYAGSLAAPVKEVTRTETRTVTTTLTPGAPVTVTQTVTQPTTTTVTQTMTTTVTQTAVEKPPRDYILIGSSLSLTGPMAAQARENKWVYERAVNIVNAQGGLYLSRYGRKLPVKLIIYSDDSNPEKATANVERLCTVDGVDALLGSFGSPIQVPQGRTAEKNKTPWIGYGSTEMTFDKEGWKWTFLVFGDDWQGVESTLMFNETLPEKDRIRTMALWVDQAPMPVGTAKLWHEAAKEYGVEIVYAAFDTTGTTDFTGIILETKKVGPDLVWSIPISPDGLTILRQCRDLKFAPKWMLMTRALDSNSVTVPNAKLVQYVTMVNIGTSSGEGPYAADTLAADFEKEWGYPPGYNVYTAHACVQILFNAIERAGTLDKNEIRRQLAETDMVTAAGPVSWPYGHGHANIAVQLCQIDGNGIPQPFFTIRPPSRKPFYYIEPKRLPQYDKVKPIYPFPPWETR
jgi:branched-chain amino acid transport system substrate-binding protein